MSAPEAGPQTSQPPSHPSSVDRAVVRGLYRLLLNREAESEAAVDALAQLPLENIVRAFLESQEFAAGPAADISAQRAPWAGHPAPGDVLAAWTADTLPLSQAVREVVRGAGRSWARLYLALFSDPFITQGGAAAAFMSDPRRLAVLRAAADVEGRLEEADSERVRGWALRTGAPETPVSVELWINGNFCAASVCDGFRRDVQDRFGGPGLASFDIVVPQAARSRRPRLEMEVRVSGEPLTLGRAVVDAGPPEIDALLVALEEIRHARQTLDRLEARLPHVETRLSAPLSAYEAYRRAWPTMGTEVEPCGLDMDVIVDIDGASDRDLAQTVQTLQRQSHPARRLIVTGPAARDAMVRDLTNRATWAGGPAMRFVETVAATPADRIREALEVASDAETVLLLRAGDLAAPGALAHLAAAFSRDPALEVVYGDEDGLAVEDDHLDPDDRRRTAPRLKPGPDHDLLSQTPYVGARLAFRRRTLERVGLRPEAGPLHGPDAVLALPPEAVAHVPRVLTSSPMNQDAEAWAGTWAACAEYRLERPAEPHSDILGAAVPGAVRVRPLPVEATAAIIIPTRDALDLLRPCIDSVLAHSEANRVRAEILIIDHESREPETQAYLSALAATGRARILPHRGAFNWALMNNLAAAQAEADVLVFLNNDTIVLSPDWLDELAGQAMRPEVGVVGCRLIYDDGTLQHAGFVAREQREGFLVHEGVGAPGDDPGYLGRHALLRSAAAVTGACMAVRSGVFRRLGGFDAASFPVEGNDVDLCLRARAEGLRVLYDPYATLYHLESKTRGFNTDPDRQARAEAAASILWARWGERFGQDPGFNPHFDRAARPFSRLRPPPSDPQTRRQGFA